MTGEEEYHCPHTIKGNCDECDWFYRLQWSVPDADKEEWGVLDQS